MRHNTNFRRHWRGASLTGYGLIVGLIAITAIVAVGRVGEEVRELFGSVSIGMSGVTGGGGGSGGDEAEDTIPDSFDFADLTDQPTEATVTSEILTITGFTGSLTASITGDGSPELSVNGGDWALSSPISAGQSLQLRLTTNDTLSDTAVTTISVGTVDDSWSVTNVAVQPGVVDTVFSNNIGDGPEIALNLGTPTEIDVNGIIEEPSGKLLLSGTFRLFDNLTRRGLVRLESDGTVDTSFDNSGVTLNNNARKLARQSDGAVILGGEFSSPEAHILRYLPTGAADTSFDPGTGFNEVVRVIAVQDDGYVLVGGGYTAYQGTTANRIVRLEPDGDRDTGFLGTGADGEVRGIIVLPDNRILIGGAFNNYNGSPSKSIARLNADGTLDGTFTPSLFDNFMLTMNMQSDGKILVGGSFTEIGGETRTKIARLHANGTLDTSFVPPNITGGDVYGIAVQPDGKVVIGGLFTTVGGIGRNGVARLNADGSHDTFFNPGTGASPSVVLEVGIQSNGMILVGGRFTSFNGQPNTNSIVRLFGGG